MFIVILVLMVVMNLLQAKSEKNRAAAEEGPRMKKRVFSLLLALALLLCALLPHRRTPQPTRSRSITGASISPTARTRVWT